MMTNLKKEARKQGCLEKLGTNHPVCVACGEDDCRCLELHHIAGKAHGDELAIVCRNCHRKLSDDQKDHLKPGPVANKSQSIGYFLLGLADLFSLIVKTLRHFGEHLIQAAKEGSS